MSIPTVFLIPCVLAPDTQNEVISPQIIDVVSNLNFYFAEELRTARRFVSSLRTGRKIEDLVFHELAKGTPEAQTLQVLKNLKEDIGVLSEAGCPGVADPGAVAVKYAHQLGYKVVPLVGPSSILLALMGSGFSGQNFAFTGYLPIDQKEREKKIKLLENDMISKKQTQIFMETPFRNNQLFDSILKTCNPNTNLCVASNLTSKDALHKTLTVKDWKSIQKTIDLHKIPTIFLIG